MHASQVGQHFNLPLNFELLKLRHYPIIPTGMRYNIKGNLATDVSRFTGACYTVSCLQTRTSFVLMLRV